MEDDMETGILFFKIVQGISHLLSPAHKAQLNRLVLEWSEEIESYIDILSIEPFFKSTEILVDPNIHPKILKPLFWRPPQKGIPPFQETQILHKAPKKLGGPAGSRAGSRCMEQGVPQDLLV